MQPRFLLQLLVGRRACVFAGGCWKWSACVPARTRSFYEEPVGLHIGQKRLICGFRQNIRKDSLKKCIHVPRRVCPVSSSYPTSHHCNPKEKTWTSQSLDGVMVGAAVLEEEEIQLALEKEPNLYSD